LGRSGIFKKKQARCNDAQKNAPEHLDATVHIRSP
jgi:hypothetical protein